METNYLGPRNFVERSIILCPYYGQSTIRCFTVVVCFRPAVSHTLH